MSVKLAIGVTEMVCCVFDLLVMVKERGYVSFKFNFEFEKITLRGVISNSGIYWLA